MASTIPSTCKAVIATAYGQPADVLKVITNHPVPTPKPTEVLIKVTGSSVNPLDWKILLGNLTIMGKLSFPYVIGSDFSGTIVAVGSDCKIRRVGDKVYGLHEPFKLTSMAEYIVRPEMAANLAPTNVSLADASAIPMVYITSYQALVRHCAVKPGDKVLVIAGSSGTGVAAIQLAKALGAKTVAATCSSRNVEFVKSLGADTVIPYDTKKWELELAGQQYDIVCDCIGMSEYYQSAYKVLKPRGQYVTLNAGGSAGIDANAKFTAGSLFPVISSVVTRKIRALFGGIKYHIVTADCDSPQAKQELDVIAGMFNEGKLKVSVEKVYSYKDAAAMYTTNMAGRTRGKITAVFD